MPNTRREAAGPAVTTRLVPRDEEASRELKKRTLKNLYNARPQGLVDAHEAGAAAVSAAYGWSADVSDDEVLRVCCRSSAGGVSKPTAITDAAAKPWGPGTASIVP